MVESMLEGFLEEPKQLALRGCQRRDKVVTYLSDLALIEEFVFSPSYIHCMFFLIKFTLNMIYDMYTL